MSSTDFHDRVESDSIEQFPRLDTQKKNTEMKPENYVKDEVMIKRGNE